MSLRLKYTVDMVGHRFTWMGSQLLSSTVMRLVAAGVLAITVGFALGWVLLGLPGQRININNIVTGQPMQIMHSIMQTGSFSAVALTPEPGKAAKAVVDVDSYDMGRIEPAQVVTHNFEIENDGNADLLITGGYTTCGCTTAEISSSVIPPQKSGLITVYFDASSTAPGTQVRRGVFLETNDPQTPRIEIWIQGTINH